MNVDRIQGSSKRLKGRIQQVWGRLTNDPALVRRGQAVELSGSAQASFGRAMGLARGAFGMRRRLGV